MYKLHVIQQIKVDSIKTNFVLLMFQDKVAATRDRSKCINSVL